MKVNIPFSNHSHFYELYNIEDSSKLASKFELQDSSTLSYRIDQDFSILYDDAVHSHMNWSTLYKDFGDENTSVELIRAMLRMALESLERYDVYPIHFALLRSTPKREALRKSLELQHLEILVPMKNIDMDSKLLICTKIERFPFRDDDLKFSVTNQLAFDLAHILWINVHQGKPFKDPQSELNNVILLYHMDELQEIARRFEQPADDVWGYFIMLTVIAGGDEIWDPININKWCDFLHDALPNDGRIDKFADFLSSHQLWEIFQSLLEDQSSGKLGNEEQLNVIKKRKAYKIQEQLLLRMDRQVLEPDLKVYTCISYANTGDPQKYSHLVVGLDSHIGQSTNNTEMKNKFEKQLQSLKPRSEDVTAEAKISYMSPHVLYELQDEAYALTLFSNKDKCLEFIQRNADKNIFFITSGSLGKLIVPIIATLPQIYAIYIFCGNISYHMSWAPDYIDVTKQMFDHDDDLLLSLMHGVSDYLEKRNNAAHSAVKKQEEHLRNLHGDYLSIPADDSSSNRCLSPSDYFKIIDEKLQVERNLALITAYAF